MTKSLIPLATFAVATALGCQGKVSDQQQSESVSPDGMKATQTRSQMRDTPGGAKVKETEVRTREIITAPTTMPDATKVDPAK